MGQARIACPIVRFGLLQQTEVCSPVFGSATGRAVIGDRIVRSIADHDEAVAVQTVFVGQVVGHGLGP